MSNERSGSSFLIQSLRSHPRVIAFGEVFNPGRIGFNTPGFENHDPVLMKLRKRRPAEFLERNVFGAEVGDAAAIGFKLFYSHLERRWVRPAGTYLAGMPGLKVIHLTRRNLLRAYLSRKIASKTGVWGIRTPEERQLPQVSLKRRRVRRYFEKVRGFEEKYGKMFGGCELLPLAYEDLSASYDEETGRVQRFLGVEEKPLRSRTVVQEVRPLSDAIVNYAALEATFASSPWAEFFDG